MLSTSACIVCGGQRSKGKSGDHWEKTEPVVRLFLGHLFSSVITTIYKWQLEKQCLVLQTRKVFETVEDNNTREKREREKVETNFAEEEISRLKKKKQKKEEEEKKTKIVKDVPRSKWKGEREKGVLGCTRQPA